MVSFRGCLILGFGMGSATRDRHRRWGATGVHHALINAGAVDNWQTSLEDGIEEAPEFPELPEFFKGPEA